jgi:hypothetical protein
VLSLLDPEGRGRLVHEDHSLPPGDGASNSNTLALTTREFLNSLGQRGQAYAYLIEDRRCLLTHFALAQNAQMPTETFAPYELATHEKVGGDVERVDKGEVLMDHLDAEGSGHLGRTDLLHLSPQLDHATIEVETAGDAANQCRLPGAVVPEQSKNLTGVDGQRGVA